MPRQSGQNFTIALKEQSSGLGNPEAAGTGAFVLRCAPSPGFQFNPASIEDPTVNNTGEQPLGRLGSYFANGQFTVPLRMDASIENMFEAMLRGTWTAAIDLDETVGSLGAITISSDVVTAAGGSWITQGMRVGQMVKITNSSAAANNNRWIQVIAVTASTFTVPTGTLTDAASDAEWDIQIAKHVVVDSPPTERYFTVEERFEDADVSKKAEDCKVGSFGLSVSADNVVSLDFTLAGTDLIPLDTGNSPHFTSLTPSTTDALVLLDGIVRVGGDDTIELTQFSFTFDASPTGVATLGQRKSPDVFLSNARGTGSLSGIMADLSMLTALKAETNLEVFIVAAENETDPADMFAFYFGNSAYRSNNQPLGSDGPLIQSANWEFGPDGRGTGYYNAAMVISSTLP